MGFLDVAVTLLTHLFFVFCLVTVNGEKKIFERSNRRRELEKLRERGKIERNFYSRCKQF